MNVASRGITTAKACKRLILPFLLLVFAILLGGYLFYSSGNTSIQTTAPSRPYSGPSR